MIVPQKFANPLRKFTEWGGLAGFVAYLLQGEVLNALVIAFIIGLAAVLDNHYSIKR